MTRPGLCRSSSESKGGSAQQDFAIRQTPGHQAHGQSSMDRKPAGRPLAAYNLKAFDAAYRQSRKPSPQLRDQRLPLLSPSASDRSSYYEPETAVQTPTDEGYGASYLFPSLACNERERLTQLWLLQHGIDRDPAFQKHLNNLISLVRMTSGYDIAILGLVDSDVYKRVATDGCPMSTQPRRDAIGAHTILQAPKTVFSLSDMDHDERFAHNPNVQGVDGLKSYAGAPIAYKIPGTEFHVMLGSLCVASSDATLELTPQQEAILLHFAEVIMHAISSHASVYRQNVQRSRREHLDLLVHQKETPEAMVHRCLELVKDAFPHCRVSFQEAVDGKISLLGESPFVLDQEFARKSIWENDDIIVDYINNYNHNDKQQVYEGRTVRAIIFQSRTLLHHYLTVSTSDVKFMFDVTDVMFIQSVDLLITGILQDKQLRDALDSKKSFLREVQHSLRTSLNGILSASEMLLDDATAVKLATTDSSTPSSPEATPDTLLATIDTSGRRLLSVINNLLDYDTFTEQVQAVHAPCNLHDIIEGVLEVIALATPRQSFSRTNLLVEYLVQDGIDGLCTDAALLHQILAVLLQNALEATMDGEEVGTVILRVDYNACSHTLRFEVSDTGCGLKERDQERIFEPFQRVDIHRQSSGLGLAFARKNAVVLGGSLHLLSSVVGQGSTFCFSLPDPVLTCSRNAHGRQVVQRLANYSYSLEAPDLASACLAEDLQRLGSQEGNDRSANFVIITPSQPPQVVEETLKALEPHQIAIGLQKSTSALPKSAKPDETSRIVYCNLPVCRNRLLVTIDQATSVLASRQSSHRPQLGHNDSGISVRTDISQLRLLLVDDNVLNLNVLQAFCKRRKYTHFSAADGNQAYDTYVEWHLAGMPCNFIVMDLQMPNCDGIEATLRIREYERTHGLSASRIHMVTGQSSDADKMRAIQAGCDSYYVKPLRIKALDSLIALHFQV